MQKHLVRAALALLVGVGGALYEPIQLALIPGDYKGLTTIGKVLKSEGREPTYTESETVVQPGSRIICYSDGIYDVENPQGKSLGEARYVRKLLKLNALPGDAQQFVKSLIHQVDQYRQDQPLKDDLSLICLDFS